MKLSFFDRLSGNVSDDTFDSFDDEVPTTTIPARGESRSRGGNESPARSAPLEANQTPSEGQLPVDVYQTPSEIVVRAFVAGVRADELNISISREMVEIEGMRAEREQISGPDYFTRELFWGSFTRAILLPQEVDVEASSASAKDGLVTIILPKLDKARQTKLRVKAG
ncbi:MAG TPA: Hsp20/alpha crystallin family protein [Candidatus Paceibacterota bacterium]|nr:Hsp20/alpha crystallin family protein [Candidatus Paceibacterota bacterium]